VRKGIWFGCVEQREEYRSKFLPSIIFIVILLLGARLDCSKIDGSLKSHLRPDFDLKTIVKLFAQLDSNLRLRWS